MTDEKARECLKSLKNICGIQPNKAYIEYKNFLRNSEEDNLKTIEERTVWIIKEDGYSNLLLVFIGAFTLPLVKAEVEVLFYVSFNILTFPSIF